MMVLTRTPKKRRPKAGLLREAVPAIICLMRQFQCQIHPRSPKTLWSRTTKNPDVLGHSLVRLLVRLHRSLVALFRTTRFARVLHCAHLFTRLLTSLRRLFILCFFLFWTIVDESVPESDFENFIQMDNTMSDM